ncbi:hypothetical protein [Acaryochloris sp. IP29b_bin.137]|uniref:hypothetical protein n=1 Tax=Acaryochloris sp. IP29b_bin.137 TaxID=2969217 RepID=UPI0026040664|nr:hypothetical protein [Acaryochloris sp. IP29b_bin.137]
MVETFILTSKSLPLAQFEHEESDMWYLFGKIKPLPSSQIAIDDIFQVTKNLEFRAVLSGFSQGFSCELQAEKSTIHCILMECNPTQVILRMLTATETIEWSRENLRPLLI